ncbi:hypothetical protein VP01_1600g4 [Puccinia sorghi]|uniref:Uncharacterized protein n=1 Tax=Puccinia sorghi TaxID=27349 RepID=A0A0L6VHG8_9BASI|nr:hypothetical protein VP01_1600g4 [Puccinia sorghi]
MCPGPVNCSFIEIPATVKTPPPITDLPGCMVNQKQHLGNSPPAGGTMRSATVAGVSSINFP